MHQGLGRGYDPLVVGEDAHCQLVQGQVTRATPCALGNFVRMPQ